MTENRRCDGHRDDDWLDEEAAERLLRGESVLSGGAAAARLTRLLTAAALPTTADQAREEAAVAAFRTCFEAGRRAGGSPGVPEERPADADFLSVVRLGRPVTLPGAALPAGAGRTGRAPKALKASVGTLVVALALCAAALVAGPGILPTPFDGDDVGSAPVRGGPPRSATPDGAGTAGPNGGSTPLTGGTADAPPGTGAPSQPGRGATASPGRPAPPASPSATPQASHPPASKGTRGERDRQNAGLCRAYIKAGGRVDAASSARLVAAAGSRRDIPKYCARVLATAYLSGSGTAGDGTGGTGGGGNDGAGGSGRSGGADGGHGQGDGWHDEAAATVFPAFRVV
ncbi:hypothetical protein [Streptomyces sp. SPB162]|uniref:hypothetical protein n=1 Tax=Streptomyces sp. SPB162 TaxID=2940560 RepID=UPI0024059C69|nr:hypothetical protein [Streptomyces sp. SPB162]MDF9815183.1 hypothetical protein [Streptomyces sp. SPB162]